MTLQVFYTIPITTGWVARGLGLGSPRRNTERSFLMLSLLLRHHSYCYFSYSSFTVPNIHQLPSPPSHSHSPISPTTTTDRIYIPYYQGLPRLLIPSPCERPALGSHSSSQHPPYLIWCAWGQSPNDNLCLSDGSSRCVLGSSGRNSGRSREWWYE